MVTQPTNDGRKLVHEWKLGLASRHIQYRLDNEIYLMVRAPCFIEQFVIDIIGQHCCETNVAKCHI